ncbi:hypothetical protein ACC696_38035, partial [Rhizobium ruizarguesonis]
FLGDIVDWLTNADRATFLDREGHKLFWMAALVLVGLPRTASEVCITLVATRPANSLEKNDMLWRSRKRCICQRAIIG